MATVPPVDYLHWRVRYILEGPGEGVLKKILKWGTNTPTPSLPLSDYLDTLPQTSTAHYKTLNEKQKKKIFNKDERQTVTTDPSWDTFDISLVFKAIRYACENIADPNDDAAWQDRSRLEGLVREIKNERNKIVHEKHQLTENDFQDKVRDLKDLFVKALYAAKTKYNVSDQEITQHKDRVLQDVEDISKCFTIEDFLRQDCLKQLPVFKNMFVTRLRDIYERTQVFDPLCFLSGSNKTYLGVQDIFVKILISTNESQNQNLELDCFDILKFTQSLGQPAQTTQPPQLTDSVHPQLLLLEGVAGSGKTTLLTFILSEWLKEECDRCMKHLHEYDLVLHVLCRDSSCVSLEEFLEQVLPEAVAFRPRTLTLLSECKVLILIDGLDELNDFSKRLVNDILCRRKLVPGSSVICTCRPEAKVDFLQSVPPGYRKGQGEIKGISVSERTKFVLNYYDCLGGGGSPHRDSLGHVVENLAWRDHFGLPLNLLFLATLYYDEPGSVKEDTTQTSLYLAMHEWSVDKLQDRLRQCVQMSRASREEAIRRVLDVMYSIALVGLVENRLFLSDHDIRELRKCCDVVKLPWEEVVGAFFSLRQTILRRKLHQTYHAPHKSLQEFFAAKHVLKGLEDSDSPEGNIRQLLQEPSNETLPTLRNLLHHVGGLLSQPSQPDELPRPEAMKEVVDMLARTKMRCNDWLSFLENSHVNETALKDIIRHINVEYFNEDVIVNDSTFTSAKALLPRIRRKCIKLELQKHAADGHELLFKLHRYERLTLLHHYNQPCQTPLSDNSLLAMPWAHLLWFMGRLSANTIMRLEEYQPRLRYLHLAVTGDEDADEIVSAVNAVRPTLPLMELSLHVPVGVVTPDKITTRLPDDEELDVTLILSGVDETLLEAAWRTAATLQPRMKGYRYIKFPDSNMKADEWRRMLDKLGNAGITVSIGIKILDTNPITAEEEEELNAFAHTKKLKGFHRYPGNQLWEFLFVLGN